MDNALMEITVTQIVPFAVWFFCLFGDNVCGNALVRAQHASTPQGKAHTDTIGYVHTWLKAPYPVRFVKLSSHRLS